MSRPDPLAAGVPAPLTRLQLEALALGRSVVGVVLADDVDTVRLRAPDDARVELGCDLVDVNGLGTVEGLRAEDGRIHLLDGEGATLVSFRDGPLVQRTWDLGPRAVFDPDADPAATVLAEPELRVRLAVSDGSSPEEHTVAVRSGIALWVWPARPGSSTTTASSFAVDDLGARIMEVAGWFDPFNSTRVVDLLVTVPLPDGRTRVTAIGWDPAELDDHARSGPTLAAAIDELGRALAPVATRGLSRPGAS